MNPTELWPFIEKGGLFAVLAVANYVLFAWLKSSQAKLIEVLLQTIERNTEAMHEVRDVLGHCRANPRPSHEQNQSPNR